jgi:CRP-like cAMP-binding protein
MTTIERIIATHPFTKEVNPRFLHLLNDCATFERFGIHHQLFQEGFEATRFYLIHSGSVALQTFVPGRGVTTIQTIGPGSALGWSWLYPPYLWGFTAVVTEPLEAVSLCAATLRERMEENHEFGYAIAMRVGHVLLLYLQATRRRLIEAYDMPR